MTINFMQEAKDMGIDITPAQADYTEALYAFFTGLPNAERAGAEAFIAWTRAVGEESNKLEPLMAVMGKDRVMSMLLNAALNSLAEILEGAPIPVIEGVKMTARWIIASAPLSGLTNIKGLAVLCEMVLKNLPLDQLAGDEDCRTCEQTACPMHPAFVPPADEDRPAES